MPALPGCEVETARDPARPKECRSAFLSVAEPWMSRKPRGTTKGMGFLAQKLHLGPEPHEVSGPQNRSQNALKSFNGE
jgi:hypothetical protein